MSLHPHRIFGSKVPVALLAALFLCACGEGSGDGSGAGVNEERDADVVLVVIDTLRSDFTSLRKDGRGHTPFLASLSQTSVVFENAYSPASWTLPSVASIITGLHLAEHGVVAENKRLPSRVPTLAERLKNEGYQTLSIYRNPFAGPLCELDRGYDVSEHTKLQTGRKELASFLDEHLVEGPFLLYVHNTEPHDPQQLPATIGREAPPEIREFSQWYKERIEAYRTVTRIGFQKSRANSGQDFDELQQKHLDELIPRRAEAYEIYGISVEEADNRIREIVQELKDRGRWENTLFVVMSDHGEEMGEHDGWQHDQSLYQELIHVPFLIRFPGNRFGGARVTETASLVDLVPTVIGYLGIDRSVPLTGRDWYASLVEGTHGEGSGRVIASRINTRKRFGPWLERRGDRNIALRSGRWKAIWNQELNTLELYDLEADPQESKDLSLEEPRRAESFRRLAKQEWEAMRAREEAETGKGLESLDPESLRALKELGYVGGEND